MASELALAGLIAQVEDDAGEEEIFAAQWQHELENEPLRLQHINVARLEPLRLEKGEVLVLIRQLRLTSRRLELEVLSCDLLLG